MQFRTKVKETIHLDDNFFSRSKQIFIRKFGKQNEIAGNDVFYSNRT